MPCRGETVGSVTIPTVSLLAGLSCRRARRRRCNLSRERDRGNAAAAPDVDDPFAGHWLGAIDQDVRDRSEQDILRRLPVNPALAYGAVPVV